MTSDELTEDIAGELRGPIAEIEAIPNAVVRAVTFTASIRGELFDITYLAPDPGRAPFAEPWNASRWHRVGPGEGVEVDRFGKTAAEALENCVRAIQHILDPVAAPVDSPKPVATLPAPATPWTYSEFDRTTPYPGEERFSAAALEYGALAPL